MAALGVGLSGSWNTRPSTRYPVLAAGVFSSACGKMETTERTW